MPIYDFKCKECGHRFEVLTSISNMDKVVCEKCGKAVERVYQGKCNFGANATGGGCSGNCSGCAGCNHG